MPYLHWDTARHQLKLSQALHKEDERYIKERRKNEQTSGGIRIRQRGLQRLHARSKEPGSAFRLENRPKGFDIQHTAAGAKSPKRSATGVFANIMKRHGRFGKLPLWSAFITDGAGRLIAGTELGQVLFDAAMMFEAMVTYQETSLIRKYLHSDLPLHPRRTLEQTNEWTLGLSWHASARDQVVHRATRPKQLDLFSAEPSISDWREFTHKIPRVMMIDQLWMWILDEKTIITCFPDHGDFNGHSHLKAPGIHKSVRESIMKSRRGHIHSVIDLSVVILGEIQISKASMGGISVSPNEDLIHIMQIFRQAIGDVARKHSFGAEQYWEWARIFSRLAHTDMNNGMSDLIVPFLDIGKEGELQGQIKSVVRDLDIMLRITFDQRDILEKYEKAVVHIAQNFNSVDMEPMHAETKSNIDVLDDMLPISIGIVAITYYMAFGSPFNMSRDLFRWFYIKCGMYRVFAPGDLKFSSLMNSFRGRSKKKEAAQEWERRHSEQLAKDAQDRRTATRHVAVVDHRQPSEAVPPETPVALQRPQKSPQTGMLAVYQNMNTSAGKRRTETIEMV
ncbi:hypothetical protein SLS53_008426 [Cytospora paraplurivora]|uniref:Uncharacterized protein n=1 Tax=Cytospora paraplurivora TaxID=2898453 RepID=A0AAN9YBH9_9PEZI